MFCIGAVLSGCGQQRDSNTLVIYAAGPRSLAEWLCANFEKETGRKTKLYSATTGEVMAKLMAEQYHPQADVAILASPTAAEVLKQQKMLLPQPSGLLSRPEWSDKDGYYIGTAASALGIAMRRDQYDPALEWADIFSGKFKGKLLMPSPQQSGTSGEFIVAFSEKMGDQFWNGLIDAKKHGLQVSGPNSQALNGLVLHAQDAVLASADYLVFKQIEKGEPLVMHFPASGCPVIPRPIAILKGTVNRAAADAFVKFCFSSEAQKRMAEEHLIPAGPQIPLSSIRQQAEPITAMPYDVAAAVRDQPAALMRFKYEVEKKVQ
ncbi:MAG: extracellular solute-binding protein [Terrimicrobiaceae bacterium]